MNKHYIRLADGTTGVVDTQMSQAEVSALYPAGTEFSDKPFPAADPVEVVEVSETVTEKKPRAKAK